MDRQIVWPGAIPLETDLLNTNKQTMVSIAKLAAAVLGTGTTINGLSCGPTSPASLQVSVGAGEIYALKNIDDTAYSSLTADTTHQILKQGILLDAVTLSCAAPGTTGQSINYLVQAAFNETDTNATVLPYYNASNPSQAWNGPNNSGSTSVTTRADQCVVSVKAGTAATTGTQTTPSPDSGNVGLYVVTVAYGQSTITSANIAAYSGNPAVPSSGIASALHNALYVKSVAGGSDVTLTSQEAANPMVSFTGTLTGNVNVIVPAASHQWIVSNSTSGAFGLTVKTASGTGILVPQGQSMILYCDGVNVIAAGAANQLTFTPYEFTAASNGANTFTCGYTPGNLIVDRNGSMLPPSVYTASNGSSITVNNCTIGDKVLVYTFTSFTVANALTQAAADTRYALLNGANVTTPNQFDNTTKLATTAFVQRALGNFQAGNAITSVGNFLASDTGGAFYIGTAGTYSIPLLSAVNSGATFTFLATVDGVVISRAGSDQFLIGSAAATSITLNNGDVVTLAKVGGFWAVVGGTVAARGSNGDFGKSLSANGYQKLPSGLIIQWGTTSITTTSTSYNLPIAFPNSFRAIVVTSNNNANTVAAVVSSASQFNASSNTGTPTITYLAIGY